MVAASAPATTGGVGLARWASSSAATVMNSSSTLPAAATSSTVRLPRAERSMRACTSVHLGDGEAEGTAAAKADEIKCVRLEEHLLSPGKAPDALAPASVG